MAVLTRCELDYSREPRQFTEPEEEMTLSFNYIYLENRCFQSCVLSRHK